MIVSLNGNLIHENEASVQPLNSAFYYGTGCFETLRAEGLHLLWFDKHVERLVSGLKYLGVPDHLIPLKLDLEREIKSLIKKNKLEKGNTKVRVQISLLENTGYQKDENPHIIRLITTSNLKKPELPLHLKTVSTTTVPASCKPSHFKLCNMLHYRETLRSAQKAGADDGILMSTKGYVAETSVANIFWKRDKTVFTPSVSCDILPGIIRNKLIEIIKKIDSLNVEEGEFLVSELMRADTVWCTNSTGEIYPVFKIDSREFSIEDKDLNLIEKLFKKEKQSGKIYE